MNIQELQNTITTKYAKQAAELLDGAAYAYVTQQLEHLKSIGADPSEYEVVFARDEYPKYTDDGMKVTQRIRLVKRENIENLPVEESPHV